jgi:hypothetical protein
LVLAAIFIGACASQRRGTTRDERDTLVIREVLAAIANRGQSGTYLVAAVTDPYKPWLQPKSSLGSNSTISEALVENYATANREHRQLPLEALPDRFRFVEPLELRRYFANGPREGWEAVEAAYGMRTGIVRISIPAYSVGHDEALVTLNEYGLFDDVKRATEFCRLADERLAEHTPFFVYHVLADLNGGT